jgi:hypothetical protein
MTEPGQSTRRFQTHRQDRKRSNANGLKQPGTGSAVLSLFSLAINISTGVRPDFLFWTLPSTGNWAELIWLAEMLCACSYLLSWVLKVARWTKDR